MLKTTEGIHKMMYMMLFPVNKNMNDIKMQLCCEELFEFKVVIFVLLVLTEMYQQYGEMVRKIMMFF